ncbi:hypothetical protein FHG87_008919 [Trinorchestia longiramus]|nr:hypothetical protein FHG87_008919 [Trinorchestia longiramus]
METYAFKTVACEEGGVLERVTALAVKEDQCSVIKFLESTIDWLVAETDLAPTIAALFAITTSKIVKWQCKKCSAVHQEQVSPSSCYRLRSAAQLDHELLARSLIELTANKEFGVQMVCGGREWTSGGQSDTQEGGCGHIARVDKEIVTKFVDLPHYLLIENQSLSTATRTPAPHVVFPEHLDLSSHVYDGQPAHYVLSAVLFGDACGSVPSTCQVKVSGGRWFSFHGERVVGMSNKDSTATQAQPDSAHPNYLSEGGVSASMEGQAGVRVSRGVLLWIYTLVDMMPAPSVTSPRASVINYINSHESQESKQRFRVQNERQDLLKDLSVRSKKDSFVLLQEGLLEAWSSTEEQCFVMPLHLFQQQRDFVCSHGKIKPFAAHKFKCIRKEMVSELLNTPCGINVSPMSLEDEQGRQQPEASSTLVPEASITSERFNTSTRRTDDVHCADSCQSQPGLSENFSPISTNYGAAESVTTNVAIVMSPNAPLVTMVTEGSSDRTTITDTLSKFTRSITNSIMYPAVTIPHTSVTNDLNKEVSVCSSAAEEFYPYPSTPITTTSIVFAKSTVEHQNSSNDISTVSVLPIPATAVLSFSTASAYPISTTSGLPLSKASVISISTPTSLLKRTAAALPSSPSTLPLFPSRFLPSSFLKESVTLFESSHVDQVSIRESQLSVLNNPLRNEGISSTYSTAGCNLSSKPLTSGIIDKGLPKRVLKSSSVDQDLSSKRLTAAEGFFSNVHFVNPTNEDLPDLKLEDQSLYGGVETAESSPYRIFWSPSDFLCVKCVVQHARFIRFLELLRRLHRQFRREAVKHKTSGCKLMGAVSLDNWPKIAAKKYIYDHKIDLCDDYMPNTSSSVSKRSTGSFGSGLHKTQVTPSSRDPRDDSSGETIINVCELSLLSQNKDFDHDCSASDHTTTCQTEKSGQRELLREQPPYTLKTHELSKELPGTRSEKQDSWKEHSSATGEQELLNEDIVCVHNELNPQSYVSWLPEDSYKRILELCDGCVHHAVLKESFDLCVKCQDEVRASETACSAGLDMKRKLNALFLDRRRPLVHRDLHKKVFLLDRLFIVQWRNYIRECMKGVAGTPPTLLPHRLLCAHLHLAYSPQHLPLYRQTQLWVLLWPDEWMSLMDFYGCAQDCAVSAVIGPDGNLNTLPGPCSEGCVEAQAEAELEALFVYEDELVLVLRVASVQQILELVQPPLVSLRQEDGANEAIQNTGLATLCAENVYEKGKINPSSVTSVKTEIENNQNFSGSVILPPEDKHKFVTRENSTSQIFCQREGTNKKLKKFNHMPETAPMNTIHPTSLTTVSELSTVNSKNKLQSNDKELMESVIFREVDSCVAADPNNDVDEVQLSKTNPSSNSDHSIPTRDMDHIMKDEDCLMTTGEDGSVMEGDQIGVKNHKNLHFVHSEQQLSDTPAHETTQVVRPEVCSSGATPTTSCSPDCKGRQEVSFGGDLLSGIDVISSSNREVSSCEQSVKAADSNTLSEFEMLENESVPLFSCVEEKFFRTDDEFNDSEEISSINLRIEPENGWAAGVTTENVTFPDGKNEELKLKTQRKKDRNKDKMRKNGVSNLDGGGITTSSRARGRPKGSSSTKTTNLLPPQSYRPSRRRRLAAVVGEEERRYASEAPSPDRLRLRVSSVDSLRSLLNQVQQSTSWPAPLQLWLPRVRDRLSLPVAVTAVPTNGAVIVADGSAAGNSSTDGTDIATCASTTASDGATDGGASSREDVVARLLPLNDNHLDCSLGQLRIRPGDTLYFQTPKSPELEPCPALSLAPSPHAKPNKQKRSSLKTSPRKILKKSTLKTSSASLSPRCASRDGGPGGGLGKRKVQTGRTVELHVTEGSRLGSQLVYPADDTGYVYRVKRIKKTTIYFSCGYTGCRACGNFKKKGDSMIGVFDLTSHHNHKRNPTHLRRLKFESVCKKRNLEEDLPASVIIKEELARWQLREEDVNLHTLNSTLYKARWRLAVDDPSSVPDVTQPSYTSQLEGFAPKQEKLEARNVMLPTPLANSHLQPQPPHQLDRF